MSPFIVSFIVHITRNVKKISDNWSKKNGLKLHSGICDLIWKMGLQSSSSSNAPDWLVQTKQLRFNVTIISNNDYLCLSRDVFCYNDTIMHLLSAIFVVYRLFTCIRHSLGEYLLTLNVMVNARDCARFTAKYSLTC